MNKIIFGLLAISTLVFAEDGTSTIQAYSVLAAGVGAAATIAGTARNPGLGGKLMTTMFIALAMIEAQVIYTLVIALIALYANPFL